MKHTQYYLRIDTEEGIRIFDLYSSDDINPIESRISSFTHDRNDEFYINTQVSVKFKEEHIIYFQSLQWTRFVMYCINDSNGARYTSNEHTNFDYYTVSDKSHIVLFVNNILESSMNTSDIINLKLVDLEL